MGFPAQVLADKLEKRSTEAGFCRCLSNGRGSQYHAADCPVRLMQDAAKMLRALAIGRVR